MSCSAELCATHLVQWWRRRLWPGSQMLLTMSMGSGCNAMPVASAEPAAPRPGTALCQWVLWHHLERSTRRLVALVGGGPSGRSCALMYASAVRLHMLASGTRRRFRVWPTWCSSSSPVVEPAGRCSSSAIAIQHIQRIRCPISSIRDRALLSAM